MPNTKKNDRLYRTMIGGQALIQGIMMRGPEKTSIVVRTPEELKIDVKEKPLLRDRYKILGIPVIRGAVGLFESMATGISALTWSAEFYAEEDPAVEPSKFDKWIENKFGMEKAMKIAMGIAVVVGVALPVGLFILLPTLLAGFMDSAVTSRVLRNLVEGGLRMVIFLLFMFAVSRTKDIQRVFAYHGAEHKTIHCYENGDELTVENVKKYPKEHPRCGTSFLLIVMVISILVFSFVTWTNPWMRMALRLLCLPLVIGLSYEANRFIGKYDNFLTMALRAPGVWLQKLTTNEPDDSMIEVGIEALKLVIPGEKGSDKW